MKVKNAVNPNGDQMKAFGEPGPKGPIYMVNLLKFKARAEYEDGRQSGLTGREAYMIYASEVHGHLEAIGGSFMWAADVTHLTIGEVEDLWDEVAIAKYPSRQAMREMTMKPEFQASSAHRTAGLEGQLNIETVQSDELVIGDTS